MLNLDGNIYKKEKKRESKSHFSKMGARIGEMQFLKIARFSNNGAYLIDDCNREILLPNKYLKEEYKENSLVWVFVYTDSEDRIIAITDMPKALLGDIVALDIVHITNTGVYLNLGIPKDLFMPSKNPSRFKIGEKIVVKIDLDKENRLIARSNLDSYLRKFQYKQKIVNDVVLLPFRKTSIGYNCVVNNKYFGIIHNNDVNSKINIGEEIKGKIKNIRDDGKLDLSLKSDFRKIEKMILEKLKNENEIKLDFLSSKEEIFNTLGLSKKGFKRAANELVRMKKAEFIKDNERYYLRIKKSYK